MKLENKISIITGGAAGIGKTICRHFLDEGAIVYIFDINESVGQAAMNDFANIYGKDKIFFEKVNVSDEAQVETAIKKIVQEHGGIDILVNNAGITLDNLILRMSLDDWKKVIDINLTGAFICSKHVVKHMVKKRSGKIVSIYSIVGVRGNAGQCNYSA